MFKTLLLFILYITTVHTTKIEINSTFIIDSNEFDNICKLQDYTNKELSIQSRKVYNRKLLYIDLI